LHDSASSATATRVVAATAFRRLDIGDDGLLRELDCQCVSLGALWSTPGRLSATSFSEIDVTPLIPEHATGIKG